MKLPWAGKLDRRRRLALYAIVAAALGAFLLVRGWRGGGVFEEGRQNDLRAYHLAARGVWERDLVPAYDDAIRPFLYPPPCAVFLSPLGLLPYRVAAAVWTAASLLLVFVIFRSLDGILGLPLSAEAKLAGFLLAYRLIESDFANGNANTALLALFLAGFRLARGGRSFLGGCVLAAAALFKVSPIIALPWILYRRRWRMLGGFVAGLATLGLLLPLLALGARETGRAWNAWHGHTLALLEPWHEAYAGASDSLYVPGQGLRSLLHRLLRHADATAHDDEVVSVHWLDLPRGAVDGIYFILALATIAALLRASRRRAPGTGAVWSAAEIAAACAATALLFPVSRKAHFVLIWPAAVLGFEAWWQSDEKRLRLAAAVLWLVALALVVGTSPGVLGRTASAHALGYCPLSGAAACLLVLVLHPRLFPRSGMAASRPCDAPAS